MAKSNTDGATTITFNGSLGDNFVWTGLISNKEEKEEVNLAKLLYVKHIYADPYKKTTVVVWADGSKTKVKCSDQDEYSLEAGFWAALAKKVYGGYENYARFFTEKKVTLTTKFNR